MCNYKNKLKALLHDPVDKIWCFSNVKAEDLAHRNDIDQKLKLHEKAAEDLYRYLFSEPLEDDVIRQADHIASSVSRIIVSPQIDDENKRKLFNEDNSIFLQDAKYVDFLSERELDIGAPNSHKEVVEIFKKLGDLNFNNQEERARYYFLFLWRFLPEVFPWINTHPADTRAYNHSIYDHIVQTSAIATCLENKNSPAFLLWTIGPVQNFIASARRTSDLWAGSYLLSFLTYLAIEVVMQKLGPDHIVFPNLLGQPLVDKWLYEHLKDKVTDIQQFIEWKTKWENQLSEAGTKPFDDVFTIANIPNRFLAIVPFSYAKELAQQCKENINTKLKEFVTFFDSNTDKSKAIEQLLSFFNIYWVIVPWMKDDDVNPIDTALNTYKNLIEENNKLTTIIDFINKHQLYKPANIGICYSLLIELTERFLAARKNIRDFVNIEPQEGKKCSICGQYSMVGTSNEEELCAVCLLKRQLPEIMKRELSLKEKVRFPSTSEMPTVKYKEKQEVQDIAKELISKLKSLNNINIQQFISIPKLKGNPLYTIDGQFLMESTYRKEYLEKEYGVPVDEIQLEEIKKFLNDQKIKPPVYYAIVAMDGDEMGKWLSGEKLPSIKRLLHSKAIDALQSHWNQEDRKLLDTILDSTHPMSPSFHSGFSRRLSNFALKRVRQIVEEKFYGKLVYAGGDDVLAFFPVEDALKASFELQKAFQNELSPKSTMSAGIVFVHHKYPLQLALHEVRDAEKLAKKKYGRNACCIKMIKGSGEYRVLGFSWRDKDFVEKIIEMYVNEKISSQFAYDFMEIAKELSGNNAMVKTILRKELKRIYWHKIPKGKRDSTHEDFLKQILEKFDTWQYDYSEFADAFIIARFISKEGSE